MSYLYHYSIRRHQNKVVTHFGDSTIELPELVSDHSAYQRVKDFLAENLRWPVDEISIDSFTLLNPPQQANTHVEKVSIPQA